MTKRKETFGDFLERIGMYKGNKKPASYLTEIQHSAGTVVGYWHEITDFGQDGLACGESPYYSIAEIIVPEDKLFITARSAVVDDDSDDEGRFFTETVLYEQGPDTHQRNLRWASRRWEKYDCHRVDEEIDSGVVYAPFVWFNACHEENGWIKIRVDQESLFNYLVYLAWHQDWHVEEMRDDRGIVRFFYGADPDSFRDPVTKIYDTYPQLLEALRRVLPVDFEWGELASSVGEIEKDFANSGCRVSASSIRMFFRELKIEPISRRNPPVYHREHCNLFEEYRRARMDGASKLTALAEVRMSLADVEDRLRGPDLTEITTPDHLWVSPVRFHRRSLFAT